MQNFGELIRSLRIEKKYPLRKVAAYLDIDQAILSKIERGQRKMKKDQVIQLARFFNYDEKELMTAYLSDKILYELADEEMALEALKAAEEKIAYQKHQSVDRSQVVKKITNILKRFPMVTAAWLYGSFSRNDDRPGSDIDLAVETEKGFSYFDLAAIKHQLEKELQRKIDVGFMDSFRPHILKNVKPDLKLIYERRENSES